jgi:hypothetical protein
MFLSLTISLINFITLVDALCSSNAFYSSSWFTLTTIILITLYPVRSLLQLIKYDEITINAKSIFITQ